MSFDKYFTGAKDNLLAELKPLLTKYYNAGVSDAHDAFLKESDDNSYDIVSDFVIKVEEKLVDLYVEDKVT